MKVLGLIEDAFGEIGVLAEGGTLSDDRLAWGLRKLNYFLSTLSADGLNIDFIVKENFSLVSGTVSYTIGVGGVFNTALPTFFQTAFIREDDHDYEVLIRPIEEYWNIADKTIPNRPNRIFYSDTPLLGTIYFNFVPDKAYDFHFTSFKPYDQYTAPATDDLEVPKEHEEMLMTNLAVRIAGRFGRSLSRQLVNTATNTLDNIRGNNLAKTMKGNDFRRGSRFYDIDADK